MLNWLTDNLLLVPLIVAGLVVVSWLLGRWMAKSVRMPDYGWKFSLILFALFASVTTIYRGWPPHFGIDLGGGAVLVYRVDKSQTDWRPDKMDALIEAISQSVNPGGQKEISVRSLGQDMVQITMPAVAGATAKEKTALMEEVKKHISTQARWSSALWPRAALTSQQSKPRRWHAKPPGKLRHDTTTTRAKSFPIPGPEEKKSRSGAAYATRKPA